MLTYIISSAIVDIYNILYISLQALLPEGTPTEHAPIFIYAANTANEYVDTVTWDDELSETGSACTREVSVYVVYIHMHMCVCIYI